MDSPKYKLGDPSVMNDVKGRTIPLPEIAKSDPFQVYRRSRGKYRFHMVKSYKLTLACVTFFRWTKHATT